MKPFANLTILIAEYEVLLRGILKDEFQYFGASVLEAPNGRVAFELFKKSNVDVVISDVRMPGGDGLELIEKIRTAGKKMPIFFFSTAFADISEESAAKMGAAGLFSKPYDLKTLIDAVKTAVDSVKKSAA